MGWSLDATNNENGCAERLDGDQGRWVIGYFKVWGENKDVSMTTPGYT